MFVSDLKEKRYYLDDPYEKYNKMSFLKHRASLEKNAKLIEEHGNKAHHFDRYQMHRSIACNFDDRRPEEIPMPPGYLKTVKDNNGVFKPEGENVHHEPEWMAPHFQRTKIRRPDFIIAQHNFRKCGFFIDKDMKNLRKAELFSKRLRPWSRIMHKMRY